MCSCTYECLSPDKASPSHLLAIFTRWTHCKCLLYVSSIHSALLVLVLSPDNSFYTMVCAPSTTFPYVYLNTTTKFLTLLVLSQPKLRDQPPGHCATSQQWRLHNLFVPSQHYCNTEHRQDIPAELTRRGFPDITAQSVRRILPHSHIVCSHTKLSILQAPLLSAYFLLHPV